MTVNRWIRPLCLALVPVGLALLASPADAQPRKSEPREVRAVRSEATRVARARAARERALANARDGTDLSRCCARQINALEKSVEGLASRARPVQSRLTRSKSGSVGKSARELSVALSEIQTNVSRLKKSTDRKSADRAVGQIATLQARFDAILVLLPDLWETDEYADLVAPLNRCTELVRKVCGDENECADASTCPLAKQMLEMYNDAATDQQRYDLEGECIIALDDHIVFSMCVP